MREITYRDALREALREEMRKDPRVFCLGEDIADPFGGSQKVTLGLGDEFGAHRVRNTPVAENAIIGAAIGAALTGMLPVAEIQYVDFTADCMDQIVNQAAKLRYMSGGQATIPMVIRTQQGSGRSAATQHAQSLEAWFAHVPGIKVVCPATPYDAKGLLKTAIHDQSPVLFIEHKMLYNTKGPVPEEEYTIPFGQAHVVRPGRDISLITYFGMLPRTLEAADRLAAQGVEAEVIDLRTLNPLDEDTLVASVHKTGKAVIVHEACRRGGFGAEIAAVIAERAFYDLQVPIRRVTMPDIPVPFAPSLESWVVPSVEVIATAVLETLGMQGQASESSVAAQ